MESSILLSGNQLIPKVPGIRHDFVLSFSDFNNSQQLPASTLLKYSTDARWMAFATWPALKRMMQEEPSADVLVKQQMIRFLKPNKCLPGNTMGVLQTPHAVGARSLTLAYEFFDCENEEPFAQVLSVCVRVRDGSSLPLPSYIQEDIVWRHRQVELEDTKDLVLLSNAIEKATATNGVTKSNRLRHEVLVRPSDTDRRKIVNNNRMMQFFEDAIAGTKVPDLIYTEVLSELRAKTWCDVLTVPNTENGGNEMISFLVDRDTGQTIARSYTSWVAKVLTEGK